MGVPSLDPRRIRVDEWDRVELRAIGLAPNLYLEAVPEGLRAAPDLRIVIGDRATTLVRANGAGIDVRLTEPLSAGFHDLDVHARGRDFHVDDALEVVRAELDAGLGDDAGRELTAEPRQIATGDRHTCVIGSEGALYCFGGNQQGQLGTGGVPGQTWMPLAVVGLGAVVAVDAGLDHTCAITTDGRLWCWGRGGAGQLGLGDMESRSSPAVVGTARWVAVATGAAHTCGIQSDGSLWCWGAGPNGELGLGTSEPSAIPARLGDRGDWRVIAAGQHHSCAIPLDGSLWCWGENTASQLGDGTRTSRSSPVSIAPGVAWIDVAGGDQHSCGVRTDGVALCWGKGVGGRLGTGNIESVDLPSLVDGGLAWSAVTAGKGHSCAIEHDGSAWCWGETITGAVGIGAGRGDSPKPQRVAAALTFVAIDTRSNHTCALTIDGTLYCWGDNGFGEAGVEPTSTNVLSPVVVDLP